MKRIHLDIKNKFQTSVFVVCCMSVMLMFAGTNVRAQEAASDAPARKQNAVTEENLVHTVKGRVVTSYAREQGFPGARINVVNTKITAMSKEDGSFEIKVPRLDVVFSVEAPGYQNQVVALKGRDFIEIPMLQTTEVPSFYDNTEFSSGSPASVSKISKNVVTIDEDITSRLSGQVRSIAHSGMPGIGSSVFVRGLNSVNASVQPLYVVDGVIWQTLDGNESVHSGFYNNPLALIDPNDVEKITVLKSGNSIYGSKGSNGVILIDTKRAHSAATEVSADISFGYRSPIKSIPVMNASEYRIYASDIISGMYSNTTAVDKFKFLDDDVTKSYYKANHNNTDWLDLINDGAMVQNYGISVRGGDDIALYSFSMGYNQSDGNIDETGFNRMNARFNTDINMTDRLKLRFDISFTQAISKVRNDGIDSIGSPVYLALIKSPVYSPYQYSKNGNISSRLSDTDELRVGNPLSIVGTGIGESKQYGLNAALRPSYTFGNDKVTVGVLFSYGWNKLDENSFTPDYGVAERSLFNEQGEMYAISRNTVQDRMDKHTSITVDGRVDWNILRNSLNNLKASGGYRYFSDTYKSHYAGGHNTGSDKMTQITNTTASLRTITGLNESWRSMAWYANADYSFKSRYLLSAEAAMDASSRFGGDADGALHMGGLSWGIFPAVSGGWIISSEDFMKNVSFINFLKLTAGYSITGNDNIPNFASRSYFSSIHYRDKTDGLSLSNIGNEKLKWESTGMAKVGLDFSMFNNRWFVRAEYYTSKTKDLLTQKELNEVAGLKYFWSNDGELKNNGFEISTNFRILDMKDWKLDFGASIGHYKNEITSLANGAYVTNVAGAQILTEVGQPAGVFFGYKTNGVLSTKEAASAANLSIKDKAGLLIPFEAGDMHFQDVDGNNVIENNIGIHEDDRQIIGDPNPDFYGNFNLGLSWKSFSLEALFTYSYGNDAYNALRANLESGSKIYNQSTAMQNRWVADGQVTEIPRAVYGDPMGNSTFSDRWIEDASYLKFKSLTLSYKLPLNLSFLQEILVWGSVNNIYTFTKYLGADPEFSYGNSVLYQGVDAGLIPQTRAFNLGVKINL